MIKYDQIPKSNPDFSKHPLDIAEHYQDAYFAVKNFCIEQIYKSECWKMAAITGWIAAGFMFFLMMVK